MGSSVPTSLQARPSLDAVGATASLACAVHCVAVALLLGGLPAASFLAAAWIDWVFLAASLTIGVLALVPGYRRHHRRTPLVLFVSGITVLVTLRSLQVPPSALELMLVLVAAACLVMAHWKNRGALHRCACGPQHH
ncbi:MAG: MerC domain-containing protein [Gemmatimonadaceae bacterium]|nr:MerC domain-containing protein [Gemmatimonadaceae bacterium]